MDNEQAARQRAWRVFPSNACRRRRATVAFAAAAIFATFSASTFADVGAAPLPSPPSQPVSRFGFADRTSIETLAQSSDPAVRNSATGRDQRTDGATPEQRRRDWDAEMATRKSYVIPALDIVGFDFLLNRFDRYYFGKDAEYSVTARSIRNNLRGPWVVDSDPFQVNQFLHPYQGSMYHGFARSAGLNYWESLGYTFAGSAFWEIFGETTPPSKNDQVNTGIGGSFLGEALFRMASLMLEKETGPRWVNQLGAAVVSPSTAFNRWAFGERFHPIFPSHDADYYSRLAIGVTATTQNDPGLSQRVDRTEGVIDFAIDYGNPGKPGYQYRRPFDYFTFQLTAASGNRKEVLENIMTKGLLVGRDYSGGDRYRGVWGVYGSYDYFAPQVFRVSSTALSVGTTGQLQLTDTIALQGTGLIGAGYAAVSTLHGTNDKDYHYGIAPQALVSLRLIYGSTASLDFTGREYFVSKVASSDANNHDNIVRFDTALTWRVSGPHAVSLRYIYSRRDSSYGFATDNQSRGTIGLFYTLLGSDRFGAADWRNAPR